MEQCNPPIVREDLRPSDAVLANILPDLKDMFPDLGPMPEYSAEQLAFEIAQSLGRFFLQVAKRRPSLILFDDLHCADALTLEVLAMAMRELNHTSVH